MAHSVDYHGKAGNDKSGSNKRTEVREVFTVTMKYDLCESITESNISNMSHTGLSTNLSAGGLGFFTDHRIEMGQCILVFSDKLSNDPVSGEVRWCSRHTDYLFKVGMAFH